MKPAPIDLDELFTRKKILSEAPEDSVLAKLLPIEIEPSILIYGPSKAGKTRIAAWEATALASKLNRRVEFLITEANFEDEDARDLLYACMYHNVYCRINRFDHVRAIDSYIRRIKRLVEHAFKKGADEELESVPKVYVIDSIAAFANLVLSGLSGSIVESGAPTTLPYIYPHIARILDPIRRLLSADYLNGYLLMVTHETGLRGQEYVPGTKIKSKPKYVGGIQYTDDTEVYFGTPANLPDCLLTCKATKENPSVYRPMVVVYSRRAPDRIGYGCAVTFKRLGDRASTGKKKKGEPEEEPIVREGVINREKAPAMKVYEFIPVDMLPDESNAVPYTVKPLMPIIGCGPKRIR